MRRHTFIIVVDLMEELESWTENLCFCHYLIRWPFSNSNITLLEISFPFYFSLNFLSLSFSHLLSMFCYFVIAFQVSKAALYWRTWRREKLSWKMLQYRILLLHLLFRLTQALQHDRNNSEQCTKWWISWFHSSMAVGCLYSRLENWMRNKSVPNEVA